MFFFLTQTVTESVQESLSEGFHFWTWDALTQFFVDSVPTVISFIIRVIIAIVVLLIGRWVIRLIRRLIDRALVKSNVDEGVRQFFDRLINVALWVLLILLILGAFGITASSVVAIIGSIGLSVGLALQGSLSNFAGGVLILMIKPFRVGDYIKDSNGNEGTVTNILLFYTELTTIDNKVIVIPNGELSNASLTNYSQQEKRRVDLTVGVSYHADLALVKKVLTEVAEAETQRLPDEEVQVFVSELGEHAVVMGVRVWVATADYWPVKWRLTERIKLALDENHIEIPFPQVTVSYEREKEK